MISEAIPVSISFCVALVTRGSTITTLPRTCHGKLAQIRQRSQSQRLQAHFPVWSDNVVETRCQILDWETKESGLLNTCPHPWDLWGWKSHVHRQESVLEDIHPPPLKGTVLEQGSGTDHRAHLLILLGLLWVEFHNSRFKKCLPQGSPQL